MAETVASEMPSAAEIAANKWLSDDDLNVYSTEYSRTGFQGGLQGYPVGTSGKYTAELQAFSGRTIDVPSSSSVAGVTGASTRHREPSRECRRRSY
jgi:hypothetical protein